MHPEEIKAAIRMKRTTAARIADELGVSGSTLSQVILGKGTSARVKRRIAEVTGLTVEQLWPPASLEMSMRRKKVRIGQPTTGVPA